MFDKFDFLTFPTVFMLILNLSFTFDSMELFRIKMRAECAYDP